LNMRKVALSFAIIGLALPFLAASPAEAQASRTWVSGVGDDNNAATGCSRTAPCRFFSAAIGVTSAGGEINCLDSGGFGTVTITKAITITCEGVTAGDLNDAFNGINISAGTSDVVTLRGLDINGFNGFGIAAVGINVTQAKEVHIEKCTIRNFIGAAVFTQGGSTVFLYIVDTVISSNHVGVLLASSGGFKVASMKNVVITGSTADGLLLANSNVYVNVNDSIISGNAGSAVNADASSTTVNIVRTTMANNAAALNAAAPGSTIRVSNSDIYNNSFGILIASGATVQSDGTNKHGNSNGGLQVPNASFAVY
jgi:hypothetical protein